MNCIIVYDENGRIFSRYTTNNLTNVPVGIPYIILKNYEDNFEDENYRPIVSVDVSKEPHEVVYGLTNTEAKLASMTLDEYKNYRQEENKALLAKFLKENPILWTDGLYYGVTQEDQNEMNLDLSTYQFKQSIGDTEWKLQWHSVKSDCRDFTMEEFGALLNAIVNFVYPYRQLEMQYKEAIYSATTKEDISAVELIYSLPSEEELITV